MKKSYYAVIPASVRYDENLPANAKLLYGEITALCNEKGYCWATNMYFAELYDVTKKTVSRWISSLEKGGYIKTKLIYKEKSKEVKERRIYIHDTPLDKTIPTYGQKKGGGMDKNVTTPMDKNVKENNTVSNNTSNITDDIESPDIESPSSKLKDSSCKENTPYKKIVQAYNDICKSLPGVKVISEKRKKKMRVMYREVGDIGIIIEAFKKAESSDFLSGRNGKWNGCNFDWLINYNNFVKVIEGTYDNRDGFHGGDDDSGNNKNKYGW